MPLEPFTVVVTSCGRFDLLAATLQSLFAFLDETPARTIVIEDTGDARVSTALAAIDRPIEVVLNERRLGQMASIDRAYALVDTPLIFHCEDDWEFFRTGFIVESARVLAARPEVSLVSLREKSALNPLLAGMTEEMIASVAAFVAEPRLHPEYFGYSFNPGLRRRSDYLRLGPFARLGHEADVSYAFKKAGFRMAYLAGPAVRHIGDGRHVPDPLGPQRPTTFAARLQRSVSKRWKRLRRRFRSGAHGV